jgi:superfamily II DNA helicase RecQ
VTIVISPLKALEEDQVRKVVKNNAEQYLPWC